MINNLYIVVSKFNDMSSKFYKDEFLTVLNKNTHVYISRVYGRNNLYNSYLSKNYKSIASNKNDIAYISKDYIFSHCININCIPYYFLKNYLKEIK